MDKEVLQRHDGAGRTTGGQEPVPAREEEPLGAEFLKQCSLNRQDGLRQFSLTPHPNTLPQEFLEQQQAESAVLLSRCRKSRIIRFVGLELRLPDGTPHSFTPSKPIMKPPLMDPSLMDMSKRASWQISLSPSDPIRAKVLPPEGIVLLKLKGDLYGGQYDLEDFVPQGATSGFFVVPLYSSGGTGEDMHPIFTHLQISVDRRPVGGEGIRVARVSLLYIPASEMGNPEAVGEPSSPPVVYPILPANFTGKAAPPVTTTTHSSTNKKRQEPELPAEPAAMVECEDHRDMPSESETIPRPTSKRRKTR